MSDNTTTEPPRLTEEQHAQLYSALRVSACGTIASMPFQNAAARLRWVEDERDRLAKRVAELEQHTLLFGVSVWDAEKCGWIPIREAVAEIERLRAEVADLKAKADPLAEMWAALAEYQLIADANGHGESWARMCRERTAGAAEAAWAAARADAAWAATAAAWAAARADAAARAAAGAARSAAAKADPAACAVAAYSADAIAAIRRAKGVKE